MKVALSGLTRRERLDQCLDAQIESLVLDYALVSKLSREDLVEVREHCSWLVLDFDMTTRWNRMKALWESETPDALSGRAEALDRVDKAVKKYGRLIEEHHDIFDVICVPRLPVARALEWEKFLKTIYRGIMVTATSLDDLESLIPQYSYIALDSSLLRESTHEVKVKINAIKTLLRSFSCHLHSWGAVDKETVLSGAFKSGSSSSWLSGAKYGNTYEYVGNLKLSLYHATKGAGKDVRKKLKAKCKQQGIDHKLLLQDDRYSVDQWNLSQWRLYAEDAEKVTGYWEETKSPSTETALQKISPKTLAHSTSVVEYSRFCNSCYLSEQCPVFVADSACNIPTTPQVKNHDDVTSLLNKVIQIQGDRVLFSAYAERVQNAGINPEVSKELETLTKLMKDAREITAPAGGEEVMIKAKGSGVISRLFGGYGRNSGGTKPSMSENIIDVSPLEDDDE